MYYANEDKRNHGSCIPTVNLKSTHKYQIQDFHFFFFFFFFWGGGGGCAKDYVRAYANYEHETRSPFRMGPV